ncbi:MAG: methyltransferase [Desulforegulaceae bacterium]|nr:methyltransferase [Desulforegulaceae bacterium]
MVILDKAKSYMESRILLTGAELDIFTLIGKKINRAEEIAKKTNADLRSLTRLLDALAVSGFLEKDGLVYSLAKGCESLSSEHPKSVLPMVLHINDIWNDWHHLTKTVIQGKKQSKAPYPDMHEKDREAFIYGMHVAGRELSSDIAADLDLSSYKKLLDIGGASGTYTIAFLEKNSQMKGIIFDLSEVIPMSKKGIDSAGLNERVEFISGDFYLNELPKGCDLALLSAIIHQNSPKENLALYSKIYKVLEPGGMLVIRDHIMDKSRTYPPDGAVFAINMLVGTNGGDTYTFEEVKSALEKAGFKDVTFARKGEKMDCLVTCKK